MKERKPQPPGTTHIDTFWNLDLRLTKFLFMALAIMLAKMCVPECFNTSSSRSISDFDCKTSSDLGAIILVCPGMQMIQANKELEITRELVT